MNPTVPPEASDFGASAARAFAALGAIDMARRAEDDPGVRQGPVAAALDALGADQLNPCADLDTAAAAAELCRAAGRVALPYPIVASLLRDPADGFPLAIVSGDRCRVDHGDLFAEWRVATIDGRMAVATPAGGRLASKLGPFVTDLTRGRAVPEAGGWAAQLHLTLTGWLILGYLERALELAVSHVSGRVQFGQALSGFQAVQFQLADVAVAIDGLRELGLFTLWRVFTDPERSLPDALALRVHALDIARAVLRTTQQLHGAAGMCDEYDISVLCRHIQPALRLPSAAERATSDLVEAIASDGFESLFAHGRTAGQTTR